MIKWYNKVEQNFTVSLYRTTCYYRNKGKWRI